MRNNKISLFIQAKPVWAEGREREKNLTLGFKTVFDKMLQGSVRLKVAASSIYRIFVNGKFGGCGPARGPHDYYRMDEWDLSGLLEDFRNILAIEVVGYNVNSFYLLDQPSFLQAELMGGEEVIAATGLEVKSFQALQLKGRIQKVQRYSFQRTFVEVYDLKDGFDLWKTENASDLEIINLCETDSKYLIERRVDYPSFELKTPIFEIARGTVKKTNKPKEYWRDRSLTEIGPKIKGYMDKELACVLSSEMDEMETEVLKEKRTGYMEDGELIITSNSFKILDFGCNLTGFVGFELECTENIIFYATFDEILVNGDVDYKRLNCVNSVKYNLGQGIYQLETMEPYTLKYLKLIVFKGEVKVRNVYLRTYAGKKIRSAGFKSSNDNLNRIFKAGVETFRQNALDIYMDCPSRERAGWLCDSFFTSRVEYYLTGKSLIEENFIENYLLPEKFEFLPQGMLPMCYPADHNDGIFIPNWALWFVVQLEEYLARSEDEEIIMKLRERVYGLFDYFKKFKNEDGLLEKLESWVFIEWSEANNLVQDVNYPSNMLYSYALKVAGCLYGDSEMINEGELIRKVICEQAFDGKFFVDNAIRENEVLKVTQNKTEVCQYYAFFFKIATPENFPELWETVVKDFGPMRKKTNLFPEVFPANAFIGNYLRLEILSRYGISDRVIVEIEDYFDYMAQKTGTLWENIDTSASCNHGFASHVVYSLYRDALGIRGINKDKKIIEIKHVDINLEWCEGWLPIGDLKLSVRWHKKGGKPVYRIDAPEGYEVKIE
jgi:alpha-L-rhamnosidase